MKKISFTLVCALMLSLAMTSFISCNEEPDPAPNTEPTPTEEPEKPLPENCIKDVDGNIYETIVLGKQTWMKQNLKVKHYADGTPLVDATDMVLNDTMVAYCYPDRRPHNFKTYGLLYNWNTATRGTYSYRLPSGVQGICPDGWHMPSQREWQQLTDYVSAQSEFQCGDAAANIAKALCADTLWQEEKSYPICSPAYNPETNNATDFSALPTGSQEMGLGECALFWNTSESYRTQGGTFAIWLNKSNVSSSQSQKDNMLAVRCVKD